MKNTITAILVIFAVLLVSVMSMVSAEPATTAEILSMYDTNGDGVIDADERFILDLDIEALRLTVTQSEVADAMAADGTIHLNDDFKDLATTGVHDGTDMPAVENVIVVESTVKPEVAPVEVEEPVNETVVETVPAEPVAKGGVTATTVFGAIVIVLIALGAIYMILKAGNGKDGKE